MLKSYLVNIHPQENGDHEVHNEDCKLLPALGHRKYLGDYYDCEEAVKESKKYFSQSNGCYWCCKKCHTQ